MRLSKEEELELVKKACDKSKPDRKSYKDKLFKYLYGSTYFNYLYSIANIKLPRTFLSLNYKSQKANDYAEEICRDFLCHLIGWRVCLTEDEFSNLMHTFPNNINIPTLNKRGKVYIDMNRVTDEQKRALGNDALGKLMEFANYRICIWKGESSAVSQKIQQLKWQNRSHHKALQ